MSGAPPDRPNAAPKRPGVQGDKAAAQAGAPVSGQSQNPAAPKKTGAQNLGEPKKTRAQSAKPTATTPPPPLDSLPGVGPARRAQLGRLGLCSLPDLLWHLPLRYEDRSRVCPLAEAQDGAQVLVRGIVAD